MVVDSLVQGLGRDLFNVARHYWHKEEAEALHAAIARFILHLLQSNQERSQRRYVAQTSVVATLAEIERAHVLSVLEQCGGNKNKTAAVLGVDRNTLYRMLKLYGIGTGTVVIATAPAAQLSVGGRRRYRSKSIH